MSSLLEVYRHPVILCLFWWWCCGGTAAPPASCLPETHPPPHYQLLYATPAAGGDRKVPVSSGRVCEGQCPNISTVGLINGCYSGVRGNIQWTSVADIWDGRDKSWVILLEPRRPINGRGGWSMVRWAGLPLAPPRAVASTALSPFHSVPLAVHWEGTVYCAALRSWHSISVWATV